MVVKIVDNASKKTRFPSYKQYKTHESQIIRSCGEGGVDNLILDYMIRILRMENDWICFFNFENMVSNYTGYYYSFKYDNLLDTIKCGNYKPHFTLKYISNDSCYDKKLMIKLNKYQSFKQCTQQLYKKLDDNTDLESILQQGSLSSHYYKTASQLRNQIQDLIDTNWPNRFWVNYCGSIPIELSTRWSDLDLLIQFYKDLTQNEINRFFDDLKDVLTNHGFRFVRAWNSNSLQPVYKFYDLHSNFHIDIGVFSTILILKTELIDAYASLHKEIKNAILLIKIWVGFRQLNNPYKNHTVSSYCHVIMFITYLIMIGAVPNLRYVNRYGFRYPQQLNYQPKIVPENNPPLNTKFDLVERIVENDEGEPISIYFKHGLRLDLSNNWSLERVLKSYFYFMGFVFDYKNWGISLYHGNVIEIPSKASSFPQIDKISHNTKLLRVINPFELDKLESKAAKPWAVDGMKWEFMRAYHLLNIGNIEQLFRRNEITDVGDVVRYNMYTYIDDYDQY